MRKRVLLIMMALVMLVLTAGCGDDFKGDWMRTIREGDTTQFYILHLGKADSGDDYVVEQEFRTFQKTSADGYNYPKGVFAFERNRNSYNNLKTKAGDGVLNSQEVIAWQQRGKGYFAREEPVWNGTLLKLLRQYKYNEAKSSDVYKFRKEELTLKDGKLVLGGKIYEKTDKSKLDKMVNEYKDNLKKQIGTELSVVVPGFREEQMKGVITQILIIKNGQEREVLE